MIYTKWDWIRRACRLCGMENSALIAEELDKLISKLYLRKTTPQWIEEYRNYNLTKTTDIYHAATAGEFCVPCYERFRERHPSCEGCLLVINGEECLCDFSLFSKFLYEFHNEKSFTILNFELPC